MLLVESYKDFKSLGIAEWYCYVLGCEFWEKSFQSLLTFAKNTKQVCGILGRLNCMEFQALLSLSLSPWLGIRGKLLRVEGLRRNSKAVWGV